MHMTIAAQLALARIVTVHALSRPLFLFRRRKEGPTRSDAFEALFLVLSALYESAADLKPRWRDSWDRRRERDLPPKYDFGDEIATDAAHDMRFATALLRQNRWKSVVQPLFDTVDDDAWRRFQDAADRMSAALLDISETHAERLALDEQDWITNAVEEFDDAARRRRLAERTGTPQERRVAEGTYLPVYIAIQLSDRLIERRRHEMEPEQ